jgi:(S)-2-hydroxyglutarate dehydrogenase
MGDEAFCGRGDSVTYDYCVIGAGIVGLATAMELLHREPGASLVLIEKEAAPAIHQTGHNSGVIHSGIYYAPGSLKAELCRAGERETKVFCTEHSIPFEVCGKLLVATNEKERERMEALYERSVKNNVAVEKIDAAELKRREPAITGVGALYVAATGIVDYKQVCAKMADVIRAAGGVIRFSETISAIREGADAAEVALAGDTIRARKLVACTGVQSDRVARMAGLTIKHRIVPFRGEYYRLPPKHNTIIKSLIYPIPDPDLPFLGIHLTRMIDGSVTVGPNAVLGFAREGYPKGSANLRDISDFVRFPGFWKVIGKNWRSGLKEMRDSFFRRGYLEECRKYCPELTLDDLQPMECGIRAQAVMEDGSLVHDFLFLQTDRMLHVGNAPSPAATSAIPIARMIADRLKGQTSAKAA